MCRVRNGSAYILLTGFSLAGSLSMLGSFATPSTVLDHRLGAEKYLLASNATLCAPASQSVDRSVIDGSILGWHLSWVSVRHHAYVFVSLEAHVQPLLPREGSRHILCGLRFRLTSSVGVHHLCACLVTVLTNSRLLYREQAALSHP